MAKKTILRKSQTLRRAWPSLLLLILVLIGVGLYLIHRGHATTPGAQPGVLLSWGSVSQTNRSYINGGQVEFEWEEIEPSDGQFCWENPRGSKIVRAGGKRQRVATGCGTRFDNSANGLTAQIGAFKKIGKTATVQVNSRHRPAWMYAPSTGIIKCGVSGDPIQTNNNFDVPNFWTRPDGSGHSSPNESYINDFMKPMIQSFARALAASPQRADISGVRLSPILIGTEFYSTEQGSVRYRAQSSSPDCKLPKNITAVGQQAYSEVMMMNFNAFQAQGIRSIVRLTAFQALGGFNLNPAMLHQGSPQPWFFDTHSDPDPSGPNGGQDAKRDFEYTHIRNWNPAAHAGQPPAIGYSESVAQSIYKNKDPKHAGGFIKIYQPVSWNYWNVLINLDRGTSYFPVWGDDVQAADRDPSPGGVNQYLAAYNFGNKYAGFNSPDHAADTPGAWIAFAPGYNSLSIRQCGRDATATHGNLSMFMSEVSDSCGRVTDGSIALDSAGSRSAPFTDCFEDPSPKCMGASPIGWNLQRFGRFARQTDIASGHGSIQLNLDPAFKAGLPSTGQVNIWVTYLDCANFTRSGCNGAGSWTLDWGGGQATVGLSNTGKWVTDRSINVPVSQLNGGGNDLTLIAHNADVVFHMVEVGVDRGGGSSPRHDY